MMQNRFFAGKVAIITGSSMGIGKATAFELAAKGARIVLNGRNRERLAETEASLLAQGYEAISIAGDMRSIDDCHRLIEGTVARFGRIDILINNAGKSSRGYFMEQDPAVFKEMMEINFLGCLYPTKLALPYLEQSKGSIIFISSVAGIRGLPETSLYCASKMALTSMAESLRVELHTLGIHVGIVYVGITHNEPGKTVIAPDGSLLELKDREGRKAQSPQQVARAIVAHVRKRKFKQVLTGLGKLNRLANFLFPRLVDKILVQSMEKIRRMNQ